MLPPEFRDIVVSQCQTGRFVLTTYDDCLVGFPLPGWEEFEDKLARLKTPSRKVRNFKRLVIGGAEEVVLDKQGRVQLSAAHREYAGLDREAVLVGQLGKFEVWAPERFRSVVEQDFDDVSEELAESGIDIPL